MLSYHLRFGDDQETRLFRTAELDLTARIAGFELESRSRSTGYPS
ncbi:hypothetical protein ACFOWZ_02015 [Lentzea rhizosphaerae]|uniref:Uncharacterized protein n=1 Tax=Lentzea rhizosphaerae TaxID=2041025 RepID=A0ABV8BLN2_9PSEU